MVSRITTFAFEGIEARPVDVQVQMTNSANPYIGIVGLPDKAVAESRERVRCAFASIGLAIPPKRIIVNLAPADLPKEGSHYDLAIALAMLAAMGVIAPDALDGYAAMGELALDGTLADTVGILPAAKRRRRSRCPSRLGRPAVRQRCIWNSCRTSSTIPPCC